MTHTQAYQQKLLRMAEQITAFFESYPRDQAVKASVQHMNDFWSRQMRQDLLAYAGLHPEVVSGILRDCLPLLRSYLDAPS